MKLKINGRLLARFLIIIIFYIMNLFLPFIIIFAICYSLYKFFPDLVDKILRNRNTLVVSESFPIAMEFELLKPSKIRTFLLHLLGSHKEFKIDDWSFDRNTFISSDYTTVSKTIGESINIKNILSDIISYSNFQSLIVKENQIFIYFKNNSFTKKQKEIKVQECYLFFQPKIIELKDLFLPALEDNLKHEFTENNLFAEKISKKINKIQSYYWIGLFAVLGQFLYILALNPLNILMVRYPSAGTLTFWAFSLFLPVTIYIWSQLYGSIRIHRVYIRHFIIFLPLCFCMLYHFLYSLNYVFDKSTSEIVSVNYTLRVHRGKSTSYYLQATTKNEANLPDEFSIRLSSGKYNELYGNSTALLSVQQGWLGYQYLTKISPK